MIQSSKFGNKKTIIQKLKELDYILLTSLILLGFVSLISMYATDGGEILFHTRSHFFKLMVFFPMMIILSLFNIKFWHSVGYLFYFVVLVLLILVSLIGVEASGSQRWINPF